MISAALAKRSQRDLFRMHSVIGDVATPQHGDVCAVGDFNIAGHLLSPPLMSRRGAGVYSVEYAFALDLSIAVAYFLAHGF